MQTMLIGSSPQNGAVRKLDELLRSHYGFPDPEIVVHERAESRFVKTNPELIIAVINLDQFERFQDMIRKLRGLGAGRILAVGPATDPKTILKVMQSGADLFLDEDELETELDSALTRFSCKRVMRSPTGHLLSVLSTAGGCGASTLAVNLAVILAKECGKCNLIDLNPGKAALGPLLDLKPQYTIADLCRHEDRLDRSLFEQLLISHSSGVSLLAAPREFEEVRSITARGIERAIALARSSFAQVIVDLEDCFHEEQALVLEQSTRILLTCRLDFTAIRSTRHILDHLLARKIPRERIDIVVNQFGLPNELPVPEAEYAIGGKLMHFIPHRPELVCEANNTGIPTSLKDPSSELSQSIARLIGLDTPMPPQPTPLTRFNDWLRGSVASRLRKTKSCLSRLSTTTNATVQTDEIRAVKTEEIKTPYESISVSQSRSGSGTCTA